MKLELKKGNSTYRLVCFLLLLIPFHYYVCELFLSDSSIDNLLRDIIIIGLFIKAMITPKYKLNRMGLLIGINIIFLLFSACISFLMNSYRGTFNILRTYVIPCLIFYVCYNMKIDKEKLKVIHKIIYIELAIIAVYGFFQAFFLGDDFLIKIGYPSTNGFLNTSSYYIGGFFGYQRVVGTFVSPNICGIILAIAMCALLFNNFEKKTKNKNLLIICLVIGLLGTFSRSSMLGFIMAFLFVYMIKGYFVRIKPNVIIMLIISGSAGVIILLCIDNIWLDGLFMRMFQSSIGGTISMKDLSAIKHLQDLYKPMAIVFEHPFGLGFGNNGPMALSYYSTANAVESSIFLIMFEEGILGGILFFVPYIVVILKTWKSRKYKYYTPASVSIVCFVTYLLLPNVQNFEPLFYAYFFIGLYYNPSVKKLYLEN